MYRASLGGLLLLLASCGPAVSPAASSPVGLDPAVAPQAATDTAEVLLFLAPGTDPAAYAREHQLVLVHTLRSDPDAHVFRAADAPAARRHRDAADGAPGVRQAFLNRRSAHQKLPFVSNDPYFPNGAPPGFPGQWHLGNGATPHHANVGPAWARDVTGAGVVIGIVDDCLQAAHPDLAPNFDATDSWDFGDGNADPSPVWSSDMHGTSVAGVSAARGGNLTGVTGAAPLASLAGLRVDFPNQTEQMFIDATLYHSSGGNTAIKVKNHSYGYNICYYPTPGEKAAVATSAAAGTVHLVAAGNWRGNVAQDSAKLDLQASPDVITVAALGSNGTWASYSCFGANVFVASPSNSSFGYTGITTTDRTGAAGYNTPSQDSFPDDNYTSTFGGTSSATPLAAGVMALVKQVQPALTVRFAKHLLARTSVQVDANDGTVTGGGTGAAGTAWKTNAAGFKFNQNYGFGRIDADALTQQAVLYAGPSALQTETTGSIAVSTTIPDNAPAGITKTFAIAATTPLEEMLVRLSVTHPHTGDVEAYLTSPSGTTGRLMMNAPADAQFPSFDWTFVSNAFWGENPAGTWTLVVKDVIAANTGTWNSYTATARMGRLMEVPPAVVSIVRAGASPTNALSAGWIVTFSKSVTGVTLNDFALTTTGVTGASLTQVVGSGAGYSVVADTGTGDGTLRLDLLDDDSIVDGQGNPLSGGFTSGEVYTIDKTAPTAAMTSAAPNPTNTSPIPVTVTFNEAVSGFAAGDIVATNGSVGGFAGGPSVYTFNLTPAGQGLVSANIAAAVATDAAGNGNAIAPTFSRTYDSVAPTVSMTSATSDPTNASPIPVTVTFNEAVSGFAAGDIVATNGSVGGLAGGPTVYTFNLTPAGQGLVSANIAAGVATDAAGNGNTIAPAFSRTYDSIAPTVTGVTSTTPDGTYGIGQQVAVTLTFSETVIVTGTPQLTLETGAADAVVGMAGGSGTYTVAAGQSSPDLDCVSAAALVLNGGTIRDAAGNNATLTLPAPGAAGSLGANKAIVIVDTHPPADPLDLVQRKADGATALAAGGTTDEAAVVLSALPGDPDAAQPVALQVEVRATGTAFSGPMATGATGPSGVAAAVTVSGLANGPRHWRARAVDSLGVAGNWVVFGADPAFTVQLPAANAIPSISALGQFRAVGPFPIAVGGSTDESTIVFKALLSDPEGGPLRLEVEIKPVLTALIGSATAVSVFVSSGSEAAVTIPGIAAGSWHWAARAVDAGGAASGWISFGGNADTTAADVVTVTPPAAPVPSSLAQHDAPGGPAVAAGFVDDDRAIFFSAGLPIQVEVKPVGTPFGGTPTAGSSVLGLADGGYHWQARTALPGGAVSAWLSFGGNAETAADFSVLAGANAPPVLSAPGQFKGDGATAIAAGGTTVEPQVVLRATATDAAGDRWKLQVELRPNATAFTGAVTAESALVAGTASITVAGLANSGYHWRYQAVDERGAASGWTAAGGNPDFVVNTAGNAPPSISGAGQFRADGLTAIAANGSTNEGVVIVKATVASGDGGQAVRLRVELKPNATPFTGAASATGAWGAAQVAVGGLVDGTAYHWQAWAEDTAGGVSAMALPPGDPDFTKTANAAPGPATAAGQFTLDGATPLGVGATTAEGGAVFAATGADPNADALTLQVEIQPAGTPFANAPSLTGAAGPAGSAMQAAIAGLPHLAAYHWQCRAVDSSGAVSASWTAFGGNADPADADFRTDAGFAPTEVIPMGGSGNDRCPLSGTGTGSSALILLIAALVARRASPAATR